nr:Polyketide cyclase/dehydrase [Ipomoea batatas]
MENRKWQGSVGGIVEAPIEEVWKMVSKSSKLCEWMPMVERCTDLAGEDGVPGHTRLVSGFMFPQEDGERSWIKEKLVFMDAESHSYSYRMEASNVGLDGSVNLVKVLEYDEGSTLVEWRFEMDPLEGSSEDTIMDFLGFLYKSCIHRIKGAIEVSQGKSKVVSQEIQDFDD